MQETWKTQVQSLDREDPLEEGIVTLPAFLPGEAHGQRSGGLQSTALPRVRHDWSNLAAAASHPNGCDVVSHRGFNLCFPGDRWYWAFSHRLLELCMVKIHSFSNVPCQVGYRAAKWGAAISCRFVLCACSLLDSEFQSMWSKEPICKQIHNNSVTHWHQWQVTVLGTCF